MNGSGFSEEENNESYYGKRLSSKYGAIVVAVVSSFRQPTKKVVRLKESVLLKQALIVRTGYISAALFKGYVLRN